ncbi:MAG TPA: hypothetical protein VF897_11045 [Roseiflexaceae bacterium]
MKRKAIIVTLALVVVALTVFQTRAAPTGYQLDWFRVGAGGEASGGGYMLTGAIGQPDAGSVSGDGYTLTGGFLAGVAPSGGSVYLPLVKR